MGWGGDSPYVNSRTLLGLCGSSQAHMLCGICALTLISAHIQIQQCSYEDLWFTLRFTWGIEALNLRG